MWQLTTAAKAAQLTNRLEKKLSMPFTNNSINIGT
jgi:hypothetical protein